MACGLWLFPDFCIQGNFLIRIFQMALWAFGHQPYQWALTDDEVEGKLLMSGSLVGNRYLGVDRASCGATRGELLMQKEVPLFILSFNLESLWASYSLHRAVPYGEYPRVITHSQL
jgi:hypothetical protein